MRPLTDLANMYGDEATDWIVENQYNYTLIENDKLSNSGGNAGYSEGVSQPGAVAEMNNQLENGRHYLMSVQPKDLTVEDALEAFGFGRNGLS